MGPRISGVVKKEVWKGTGPTPTRAPRPTRPERFSSVGGIFPTRAWWLLSSHHPVHPGSASRPTMAAVPLLLLLPLSAHAFAPVAVTADRAARVFSSRSLDVCLQVKDPTGDFGEQPMKNSTRRVMPFNSRLARECAPAHRATQNIHRSFFISFASQSIGLASLTSVRPRSTSS